MSNRIIHDLPNISTGDSSWFFRQNKYERQEIRRQIALKDKMWPGIEHGAFSKKPTHFYPHILPEDLGVFYESFAAEVYKYFAEADIAIHSEVLNLKSSQVACVNILFPLRQDLEFAADVMKPFLNNLDSVERIEFEDTGELASKPGDITKWLGEPPGGKRGQNRTSIDCAIYWKDTRGKSNVTLIEWKYTERAFGNCGAYASKSTTPEERATCNLVMKDGHERCCLLVEHGRNRSRHYWNLLKEAGVDLELFEDTSICPFSGPFYQIMRQFLVASYLRRNGFVQVDVVALGFDQNKSLRKIPNNLVSFRTNKEDSIIDIWNRILKGVPPIRHITAEELMISVDRTQNAESGWRNYINERYGV